jgi:hypothetical protein
VTTDDALKLVAQGGIGVVALLVLARVVLDAGKRMIEAIDRLVIRIDEHTKSDLEALGKVAERLGRLEGKIDGVMDERERTPVGVLPPRRLHGRRDDDGTE